MREKSRNIQQTLEGIERQRNDLIKEHARRQNALYQSQLMMNGQHEKFNSLLGLGNQLLMARQGLANVPLRLPQADLDKSKPMPSKRVAGIWSCHAIRVRPKSACV